jgi:glycosyltransferase involved in cell wall biosynthesis
VSAPRIAFAVLRFFHERTGNVESLRNLMTGLNELGCRTALLVPRATELTTLFAGSPVERYSERALSDRNIFAIERALVRFSASLRGRFDLLQLQLPSPAFARIAERVRRAAGLPVIASFESAYHGAPAVAWPLPGKTLLSLLVRRALNDRRHALVTRFGFDACIVASEYQRRELEAVGCRAPIHVLPNATVFERFAAPASAFDPALLGLPPEQRVIAYVGHFNFIKGVPYLVDAFERLARERSDVHLLLVGSGRGNESVAVRRRVVALGGRATLFERTVDVAALLQGVDALALPYVASYGHQLFPNLVLEALAAGVPLVTSDIPPVNEIVREGELGYLARPGDPAALAEALRRALDARAQRPELGARQRAFCRERFDYSVVAKRHLELYRGLLHA